MDQIFLSFHKRDFRDLTSTARKNEYWSSQDGNLQDTVTENTSPSVCCCRTDKSTQDKQQPFCPGTREASTGKLSCLAEKWVDKLKTKKQQQNMGLFWGFSLVNAFDSDKKKIIHIFYAF